MSLASLSKLFKLSICVLLLGGCGVMQVVGNSNAVSSALTDGKAVLIAKAQVFNPNMDVIEHTQLQGSYRPPLTYWIHRASGKVFVLGAADSEEGRGQVLTDAHYFYVLEPGFYDFAGFVQKTRFGDVGALPLSKTGIQSNIGFVNFSRTSLPSFYTYQAWVPPGYSGSTFDGNQLTHWYAPGYWDERGATQQSEATFIDFRGLIAHDGAGKPNFASFLLAPGQIAVVPDFEVEYTHDPCDAPVEGQWVCPLSSLTLFAAFTPQHREVQETMARFTYSAELVKRVESAYLLPGEYFKNAKMEASNRFYTADGNPYGSFRTTKLTLPNSPMRSAK